MECNHEIIKSVNGVIYCVNCGKELPLEFLTKKNPPTAEKAPESPVEGEKKRTTRKKVAK